MTSSSQWAEERSEVITAKSKQTRMGVSSLYKLSSTVVTGREPEGGTSLTWETEWLCRARPAPPPTHLHFGHVA